MPSGILKKVSVYRTHDDDGDDGNGGGEVSRDFTLTGIDPPGAVTHDDPHDLETAHRGGEEEAHSRSVSSATTTVTTTRCCAGRRGLYRGPGQIALTIAVLGTLAATAFWVLGLSSAAAVQDEEFTRAAVGLVQRIHVAWSDYEMAASWTHQACGDDEDDMTHVRFRELYERIASTGIDAQIEFVPYVAHADRARYEAAMKAFVEEYYPHVDYQGFVGLEPVPGTSEGELALSPRSRADFYYPIHFIEPVPGSEPALDLDVYSRPRARLTVDAALATWQPALSEPSRLVEETEDHAVAVFLFHPGTPLSTRPALRPRDLSVLVIRVPDLLRRATRTLTTPTEFFLYDTTTVSPSDNADDGHEGESSFLGHVELQIDGEDEKTYQLLPPVDLDQLRRSDHRLYDERVLQIADRQWTIVTVAVPGTYEPNAALVWVGGVLLFLCSLSVAAWVFSKLRYADMRREARLRDLKVTASHERAALILENANKATRAERTLNDFIAHEVRNPVAAAMAACSFIRTAVFADEPLRDETSRRSVREDIQVMDNSLNFVNDLLRNMLDMHRANSNQLQIETQLTDVYNDVLKPVDSMLYRRGSDVHVHIECPDNLVVHTDLLRLKQVMLNLGRNSSKFVESGGFIHLSANVVDGTVQLSVADSGKGIPEEKRHRLFEKFQESLDSLSQGTGVGLNVCKSLVELMGGEIYLDHDYHSGIEGYPGARFVINLNTAPVADEDLHDSSSRDGEAPVHTTTDSESSTRAEDSERIHNNAQPRQDELPEHLSVLFADDDMIIRRLFCRALSLAAPTWKVEQAANGETALQLVREKQRNSSDGTSYDLIFLDQYMASVEKQLLGTETARELRSMGFQGRICGLSANDMESQFLEAGANAFLIKPFPARKDLLQVELRRICPTTEID